MYSIFLDLQPGVIIINPTISMHVVAFARDDLILQFLANGGEIGVVAGDAHQQVAVLLRVALGVAQHFCIQHVDLKRAAAVLDVTL